MYPNESEDTSLNPRQFSGDSYEKEDTLKKITSDLSTLQPTNVHEKSVACKMSQPMISVQNMNREANIDYIEIVKTSTNEDSRSPSRLSDDDEGSCGRISPGGPLDEYPTETILPLQPIPQRFSFNLSHSPNVNKPINFTSSVYPAVAMKSESEKSFPSVCHSSTPSPSSSPTASLCSPSRSCSPYTSSPPLTPPVSYGSYQDCPRSVMPFSSPSSLYPGNMLTSGGIISSGSSAFLPHPRRAMAAAAAAAAAFSPASAALSPAASHLLSVATSSSSHSTSASSGNVNHSSSVNSVSSSFTGSSAGHYVSARLTPGRISSSRSGQWHRCAYISVLLHHIDADNKLTILLFNYLY